MFECIYIIPFEMFRSRGQAFKHGLRKMKNNHPIRIEIAFGGATFLQNTFKALFGQNIDTWGSVC